MTGRSRWMWATVPTLIAGVRARRTQAAGKVENDRPLECALCHLDARTDDLVATMERWWGTSYDRKALRRLYGNDLSVPVLEATLAHGLPHEQTVAIERLGHTDEPVYLDSLVDQLGHRLPLVRYYARESLRRLTGDPVALDMSLPGTELQTMGREWLRAWRAETTHRPSRSASQARP